MVSHFLILPIPLVGIILLRPICSIPESELFPHEESDGNTRFRFGDGGQVTVRFSTPFTVFNRTRRDITIRGDGVVAFATGTPSLGHSAHCLLTSGDQQTIMLFWADTNDVGLAKLTYMETTRSTLLDKAKRDIIAGFPEFKKTRLNPSWLFIVTWKDVGICCSGALPHNTYQLVLAKAGSYSFVLLYYVKVLWSNGVRWGAGFDFGNSQPLYTFPGSCTENNIKNIQNVLESSNVGEGVEYKRKWVFRVESDLKLPSTNKTEEYRLIIQPNVVSIMGNVPMLIRGPILAKNGNFSITCTFLDPSRSQPLQTTGLAVVNSDDDSTVICPVPFLYSLGRMQLNVRVTYASDPNPDLYVEYIYVVKEHELGTLPKIHFNLTLGNSLLLSASWNTTAISMSDVATVDQKVGSSPAPNNVPTDQLEIVLLEFKRNMWTELGSLTLPFMNTGIHISPLDIGILNELIKPGGGKPLLRSFALKVKYKLKSGKVVKKLLPSSSLIGTDMIMREVQNTSKTVNATVNGNLYDVICKSWYKKEPHPPLELDTLPCPRTLEQAENDWRFAEDTWPHPHLEIFNPGASKSFNQKVASPSGAGMQCTYDTKGKLLINIPGAGRYQRHSPNNRKDYWDHFQQDVMPYLCCCRWSVFNEDNCISYYSKRPSNHGKDYIPPQPSRVTGLSHISTFSGVNYTLTGSGKFWMIKYFHDGHHTHDYVSEFKMQIRMEQFRYTFMNASVITSVVLKDIRNDEEVKLQVSVAPDPKRLVVMLDDQHVDVMGADEKQTNFNLYQNGVTISWESRHRVMTSFSSGFSILFLTSTEDTDNSINIVATAVPHLTEKIKGLVTKNGLEFQRWMVNENESMFFNTSEEGQNNSSMTTVTLNQDLNGSFPENELCNGSQECDYDYFVTKSLSIAKTGLNAWSIFEQLKKVAGMVVDECQLPQNLEHGYFIVDSLTIGSNITAACEPGYILSSPNFINATFECKIVKNEPDVAGDEIVKWMDVVSNESMSSFSCLSEEDVDIEKSTTTEEPTTMTDDAVEIEVEVSTTSSFLHPNPNASINLENADLQPSSFEIGTEMIILISCLVVGIIIVAVIVAECTYSRPIRMYFVNRFHLIRRSEVEELELSGTDFGRQGN